MLEGGQPAASLEEYAELNRWQGERLSGMQPALEFARAVLQRAWDCEPARREVLRRIDEIIPADVKHVGMAEWEQKLLELTNGH